MKEAEQVKGNFYGKKALSLLALQKYKRKFETDLRNFSTLDKKNFSQMTRTEKEIENTKLKMKNLEPS